MPMGEHIGLPDKKREGSGGYFRGLEYVSEKRMALLVKKKGMGARENTL